MFKMSFGSIGTAYYKIKRRDVWVPFSAEGKISEIKDRMSQVDAVNILYSMVWPEQEFFKMPYVGNRDAFELLRNLRPVHREVRDQTRTASLELVHSNISDRMLAFMTDGEKKALWDELQGFLLETPLGNDYFQLRTYEKAKYSDDNLCWFVSAALSWCLLASNTENEEVLIENIHISNSKPNDIMHYDPFNLSEHRSNSSALCIKLINMKTNNVKEFFTHECAVEFVIKHDLLITKIDFARGTIKVFYNCLAEKGLHLARVGKKDFQQASNFILDNLSKFKPKLSWKKRRLSDMVLNGLQSRKWTAYAIYNDQNKIISYLDYKLRADFEIELGSQLTDPNEQGKGFATGLINLMCLMFISNRLFSGTYEENGAMRHVFHKCGFQPHLFFDPETLLESNKIRERIDVNDPENEQVMTNSVYYYCNSIMNRFRLYEYSATVK